MSLDGSIPAEKLRVAAATALAAAAVRRCICCSKPLKSAVSWGLHTHIQSASSLHAPMMVAAGLLHASAWNCPLELHMLSFGVGTPHHPITSSWCCAAAVCVST